MSSPIQEIAETVQTIEHVQSTFEDLIVRGLRAVGPEQISRLKNLEEEFNRIGAAHMAGRLEAIIQALTAGDRKAAAALLIAQSTLRVFDRVLTLETVEPWLECLDEERPGHQTGMDFGVEAGEQERDDLEDDEE